MVYTAFTTFFHALFRLLFTLEYSGEENVPAEGAVIVAGNHPSYLDPVLVLLPLERRVYFMAWDRLFLIPILGSIMRQLGAFPVRLGTRDPNAYSAALDVLKSGKALGIFPEAGRSIEGPMNPLKTGTARLAIESGAPIVPVTITGAYEAWPSSRSLPQPRKITVKYHKPIVLEPREIAERGDDREYHEEIMTRVREAIERRLRPSLTADERKRRVFAGPASPVRIYELYPAVATLFGMALEGDTLPLFLLAAAHALFIVADILFVRQGRIAKAARELVTPLTLIAMGPALARTVHLDVPEWISLTVLLAGIGLTFNWSNRYAAERFVRGSMMAFLLAFAVAIWLPNPLAPHLAVASFACVYALIWRPLFWFVTAPVATVYAAVLVWIGGVTFAQASAFEVVLGLAVAGYVGLVKFSAHDGRLV